MIKFPFHIALIVENYFRIKTPYQNLKQGQKYKLHVYQYMMIDNAEYETDIEISLTVM